MDLLRGICTFLVNSRLSPRTILLVYLFPISSTLLLLMSLFLLLWLMLLLLLLIKVWQICKKSDV